MNQTLLPHLESELRSLAGTSHRSRQRRRRTRFAAIVFISSSSLLATAGVSVALDLWSVSRTSGGGLCVTVGGSGTCSDTPDQIEEGRAFFVEYPPDRVVSSEGQFNRIEPSSDAGTASGVAPQGVSLVKVVDANGNTLARAVPQSAGRYSIVVPPQGSRATLQFVTRDSKVAAERLLP